MVFINQIKNNLTFLSLLKDFESLAKYMKQFPGKRFLEAMTNFHLLLFLAANEAIPFEVAFFQFILFYYNKIKYFE
jgi:nuclear protein localization family protein 4